MRVAWCAALVLLAAPVAAEATALAECAPGQQRIAIQSDGEAAATAACTQEAFAWGWLAGAGAGAALSMGWAWLGWLRWLPAMGMFTRIRHDHMLEHPLRAQIVELVEAEPGIHYQALIERTGRSGGNISHHLSMLVRAGVLSTVRRPGHRAFFVKGRIDAPVMLGLATVKSATGAAVLRAVADRPGIHKRPLARSLGCRESAVRYHVRRFEQVGLLRDGDGLLLSPVGQTVLDLLPETVAAPSRPPGVPA